MKMAKVIAKLNPFNRSSGKNKAPIVTPAGQESEEGSANSDSDMVKRRVSVSKSGRFKENHKRRSALHHDDVQDKENVYTDHILTEKDKKNMENRSKQEASNAARQQNANSMNNINSRNFNSLGRHSNLSNYDTVGSLDGHAVAEEIECLAKTLTMENSRIVSDL